MATFEVRFMDLAPTKLLLIELTELQDRLRETDPEAADRLLHAMVRFTHSDPVDDGERDIRTSD